MKEGIQSYSNDIPGGKNCLSRISEVGNNVPGMAREEWGCTGKTEVQTRGGRGEGKIEIKPKRSLSYTDSQNTLSPGQF